MAQNLATPERIIKDTAKDRSLADELLESAKLQELHSLCSRLIDDRERMAKGFSSVVSAWTMLDEGRGKADPDSVAAIERVATEAIGFAREVVQAMTSKK